VSALVDFTHLHVHSEYSFLDGMCRPRELAVRARELGMSAVALTDHGGLFGAVPFYKAVVEEGLKPIIGCELYVAPEGRLVKKTGPRGEAGGHLVVLAETNEGYHNLLKLSTKGYLEGFYYKPRVDVELLSRHGRGLIALSACLKGDVAQAVLTGDWDRADRVVGQYVDVFGRENFFLELQDHGLPEQHRVNRGLYELAGRHNLKLVATNDVHYVNAGDARAHDVLLCIQTGKNLSDPGRMRFESDQAYLKSPAEMAAAFGELPAALEEAVNVGERCSVELEFGRVRLPRFDVPDGGTAADFLRELAEGGLEQRFPDADAELRERLEYELGVIMQMGMEAYYLIVWDVVRFAHSRGIMVGPGRGSAASSLVAYLLGITGVDPVEHGLVFERFLNPERISMPDFDIDFGDRRRDEVVSYVTEKYGQDSVAQIITFGTMAARAAVKDVGRVLEIPFAEADMISKEINPMAPLAESVKENQFVKREYEDNRRVRECIDLALQLEGLTRHPSVHAAGVVIAPDELTNYTGLYRGRKSEVTTQFDMNAVEALGLLKVDVLGLKTLTVIEDAVNAARRRRGVDLDVERILYDDDATYDLLCRADTDGVFQLESEGMRDLCRRVAPRTFKELIPILALFRPGPMGSGATEQFINRKHGRAAAPAIHPSLEPILADAYGAILYQEHVMKIASVVAGYSLGQSDILRRAMGKKKRREMKAQRESFVEGARGRGYERKEAEAVFDAVAPFAEYGFNKAHATAYAVLSYRTAYLKANYPPEFMAALLTSEQGNADKIVQYVRSARQMAIEILPPEVNSSWYNFWVEDDDRIRMGMGAIKNVGRAAIDEIVAARERGGPFASLIDFCSRVDLRVVNRAVIESLIKVGAFDSFGKGRAPLYEGLDAALEVGKRLNRDRAAGQGNLLGSWDEEARLPEEESEEGREWHHLELLRYEKELLGISISGQPLDRYRDVLAKYGAASVGDVLAGRAGRSAKVGGMVGRIKTIADKKGREMAFFTLEDDGSVEIIAFADCYAKAEFVIFVDRPVLVRGNVRRDEGAYKIIAEEVTSLEDAEYRFAREIHITLPENADAELLADMEHVIGRHVGRCPVFFHLRRDGREVIIRAGPGFNCNPTRQLVRTLERFAGRGRVELR
jgi:DNA polymerase-3 subunit alpha